MVSPDIRIKFDGGDADAAAIDMRLLGLSLQGADKIISDGLILLIHSRPPKRRERAPVVAKVREPVQGAYELWALYEASKAMLPLGLPKAADVAGYFLGQWWEAVIAKFTGNDEALVKAIEAMADMNQAHLNARSESEARMHEERMAYIATIRDALAMQGRAIEQFVAPIGPSVETATILPFKGQSARLTLAHADAIRESMKMDWGAIEEITVRTDGFKFHTSGLSVENPEAEGFLMAKVSDPKFDEEENVYTEAAQRRSSIVVLARKGFKGGVLAAIEIVEFVREIAA